MKRTFLLFALLVSFSAFAQQPEMSKPQLYIVHEEVAKPSAMMNFQNLKRVVPAVTTIAPRMPANRRPTATTHTP